MPQGLVETAAKPRAEEEQQLYSVALARVVNNIDPTGNARVQVSYPWLPGVQVWARVAVPMAGPGRGTWMIPQPGDEVVVAFVNGDEREPVCLGCLWNGLDRPPVISPDAAVNTIAVRSRGGNDIRLEDAKPPSIKLKSATLQRVTLNPTHIEIRTSDNQSIIVAAVGGNIAVTATTSISLKAPLISLDAGTIQINSTARTSIVGGAACTILAGLVTIN